MTILDRIVETKRQEVAASKAARPLAEVRAAAGRQPAPRDFHAAVAQRGDGRVRLIAEIKKASPSAGLIVPDFDAVRIARSYCEHGADALSVLTDATYFQGRLEYITQVKQAVPLPVLRKDFLLEPYQIFESRANGADAVLLIAEVLKPDEIAELSTLARSWGMTVLIEVHSADNLSVVLDRLGPSVGADGVLLGINNRDLAAQRTDLSTMERLAATLPEGTPFVAESGIAGHDDLLRAGTAGACAVLVGESLLKHDDIGMAVDRLMNGPDPV